MFPSGSMSSLGELIKTDLWQFTARKEIVEHLSIGLYREFQRARLNMIQ